MIIHFFRNFTNFTCEQNYIIIELISLEKMILDFIEFYSKL